MNRGKNKIKSCNGCTRRSGDCHAHCPDYAIDRAFHEAENAEINEKVALAANLREQTFRVYQKTGRK
jgi:hypothetical protein